MTPTDATGRNYVGSDGTECVTDTTHDVPESPEKSHYVIGAGEMDDSIPVGFLLGEAEQWAAGGDPHGARYAEQLRRLVERWVDRMEAVRESGRRAARGGRGAPAPSVHLYFIENPALGLIKIGVSTNPLARMRDLQAASGVPLVLVASHPGLDRHERDLHQWLAAFRVHGEWFRDCDVIRHLAERPEEIAAALRGPRPAPSPAPAPAKVPPTGTPSPRGEA